MRRRILLFATAGVVVIAAVVVTLSLTVFRGPSGAPTPEAALGEYLAALDSGDRSRMEAIADPEHDTATEITRRLRELGGGRLTVKSTSVNRTEADHEMAATITGKLSGAPYTDTVWLDRHGDRWYVAIGPNRNAHPKGT